MPSAFGNSSYTPVTTTKSKSWRHDLRNWRIKRALNLPNLFIGIWVIALLWGERWVFQNSVEECRWENWERWVGRCFRTYMAATDRQSARRRDASPPHIPRRSADYRSAYISRTTMAVVNIDDQAHRQLSAASIYLAAEEAAS